MFPQSLLLVSDAPFAELTDFVSGTYSLCEYLDYIANSVCTSTESLNLSQWTKRGRLKLLSLTKGLQLSWRLLSLGNMVKIKH